MQSERVTVREIAAAIEITTQSVYLRAARERWPFIEEAVRGGRRRLYQINMLPGEIQAALAGKVLSAASTAGSDSPSPPTADRSTSVDATFLSMRGVAAPPSSTPEVASGATPDPRSNCVRPAQKCADSAHADPRAEARARLFDAKPESIKAAARARLAIVREYHELVARGFQVRAVVEAVTRDRGVSEATLSRYLAAVREVPEHLWLYELAPAYSGRVPGELCAEAWETLKADYLRKPAPTARSCINRLREAARVKGWKLPSYRTMLRRLQGIEPHVRALAREGREAALRLYPAQARVKSALAAMDIVNGDGYAHKRIWVAFEDGEVRRARTWFWQDVYSSKILAWRTDKTETTELIRLSFGDLIERFSIPRKVLLDNTRAAANKTMSGGVRHRYRFKVLDEEPDGVFKLLGIERVMWATPGHGQAKPIERAFGIGGMSEYIDKAADFAGAGDDKEQYDGRTRAIPIRQLEEVIAREVAAWNARNERRSPIHQGRSPDEVFAESYARIEARRATEEQRRLWLLCTEPVRVQRDATITLDAGRMVGERRANRYWNVALQEHVGRLVAARFDPARLHEGVHVYTVDGRYIAFGQCVDPAGFDDQTAARDHARDRAVFMRSTRAALDAERRMSARQAAAGPLAARNLGGAAGDASIPAPRVLRGTFADPLQRPRYVPQERSAEERAELERLEAQLEAPRAVNVLALRSDADKHAHWLALDARRAAGEQLADQEESFWTSWQEQDYFRIAREAEIEFERGLAQKTA